MDVRLPDGTIIKDVPDGMSKADLTAKLARNGYDVSSLAEQAKPAGAPKKSASFGGALLSGADAVVRGIGNFGTGAIREAGGIGATILENTGEPGTPLHTALQRPDRREAMDASVKSMGADPSSLAYGLGKVSTDVAGTAAVGGGLGSVLKAFGAAPKVVNAFTSGGFSTGAAPAANMLGRVGDSALRAGAGGAVGGVSTAMVDPGSAGEGAAIGAVTPGLLKLAGRAGGAVYNAVKGGKPGAGKMLAEALNVSESELMALAKAAENAPDEIVKGSKLTLAQAAQQQGIKAPSLNILERIVAEGPGGNALIGRYADQGTARLNALQAQGAQTYQGAAREEATRAGDKIGAVLRTQAGDDKAATRATWEALNGRASREGVALNLPLDEMTAAMGPLGRGTVGAGADANALLRTANEIGTDVLPAMPQSVARVGGGESDRTIGQAVRAIGISPDELRPGAMGGEVRWLRDSLKGGRGLVNKNGLSLDRLSERMYEAGYLERADPTELLEKLAQEAQGSPVYSGAMNGARAQYLQQGGDMPAKAGSILPKPVPFDEFQRLRSSAGELGAKAGTAGNRVEQKVLVDLQKLLEGRVDDAASGNLRPGDVMPDGFREQYNSARGATRDLHQRYSQDNNIGAILKKPVGQDYRLTGDEITNKLWHGGAGLAGDVSNLRNVLSDSNREPSLNALRQFIMTDAAGKTKASGELGAALPKYVESRMPGLQEAMTPGQLNALLGVSSDIRNAEAAAATGFRGSDTYAKTTRALDAGLLDSPAIKALARLSSLKIGVGEAARGKLAQVAIEHKGKQFAELLANPRAAAAALKDAQFVRKLDAPGLKALQAAVVRGAPLLAAD